MKKNSTLAIAEYFINVVTLFIVYKIIIINLGIEGLGIWSLILSLFSITTLGNAGVASGTVKFIAEYKAINDYQNLNNVLFNSIILVLSFTAILFVIIFIIYEIIPESTISLDEREVISPLIPIISLSYIFAIIGRIFLSTIDGLNLIYIRSIIGIISKLFFLIFVFFLLEANGLMGLAVANLIQYLVILIVGGYYVVKLIKLRFENFGTYNKNIFKKIFSYGFQFQLSSIFQMLMDPLTKFFLKDLGGLSAVGNFEIIYKFYIQIRQLIVVIVVVYVPQVSTLHKTFPKKISQLYKKVSREVYSIMFILFNSAFCFMPLLLLVLNTEYTQYMQFFSVVLYLGLIFNIVGVVPYYFNSGTGDLKINTNSSFIMAVTNIIFCLIFGYALNLRAEGVIISWAISQLISNIILIFSYSRKNKIGINNFNLKSVFFFSSLIYFLLSIVINIVLDYNLFYITILNTFLLIIYMFLVYHTNDLAKEFFNRMRKLF